MEMNDLKTKGIRPINEEITEAESQSESAEPDAVDQYMRHVGRMLYEIIRDWVKVQGESKKSELNEPGAPEGGRDEH